jgi:hypothetical protein
LDVAAFFAGAFFVDAFAGAFFVPAVVFVLLTLPEAVFLRTVGTSTMAGAWMH